MANKHIHIHITTQDADIKRDAGGRFSAAGVAGTSFKPRAGDREHSEQAGDREKVVADLRKRGYTGGHSGSRQGVQVSNYHHPEGHHVMVLHAKGEPWVQTKSTHASEMPWLKKT